MGKQTMGTPFHSILHRVDNKVFRLQSPQSPLVRNENYTKYAVDEYPLGANAIVAVIAYTGYDMEDAMIVNKFSYERGFGHASVYKYKQLDLSEKRSRGEPIHHRFANLNAQGQEKVVESLDVDGLPSIGQTILPGEPLYAISDDVSRRVRSFPHKENESAAIEDIRILGDNEDCLQKVGVKLRFNRNPVIGDKFSSRHGQKGVMSQLFPAEAMPFTESGLTPDVIINPHAFPSRMTIGMLIESMAGKSGALHGVFQDGTPFKFNEQNRAVDYFGEQLVSAGYNYVGSEPMYSGVTGEELRADIFIGVVYYQRLRHMVSDKSQVRSTGPVNQITRQPVKGRKVHGGIRFGEMERDSLLGHGAAFLLHDRLMNCSDYHVTQACMKCGSILSPQRLNKRPFAINWNSTGTAPSSSPSSLTSTRISSSSPSSLVCLNCHSTDSCASISIPFVFIYMLNELAAMNIRITLDIK
jgi:DNA-directed RNA polymerase I subunit RPA2